LPQPVKARATIFAVIRGVLGAIELFVPVLAAHWPDVTGRFDERASLTVRLLGGRQLAQALLMFLVPESQVAAVGAVVDGTHAISMVALMMLSTRWRRAALAEAVAASALAGVGASLARSRPSGPSG
jgi:hypothetical protein